MSPLTPDRPVPLTGGTSVRIAREILSRCTANVLALESRERERAVDQAILVSCDLCVIRPGIQEGFRKHLAGRLPGFDLNKLFLAATHTHDAPVLLQDRYDEKDYGDAMQPKEYVPWMYQQMAQAVVKAWESRARGAVAWGLGQAVVGHNRRVVSLRAVRGLRRADRGPQPGRADVPDSVGLHRWAARQLLADAAGGGGRRAR